MNFGLRWALALMFLHVTLKRIWGFEFLCVYTTPNENNLSTDAQYELELGGT